MVIDPDVELDRHPWGKAWLCILNFKTTYSQFEQPSPTAVMRGEAELHICNLKKTSPPQTVVCVSSPRMYGRSGYFLVSMIFFLYLSTYFNTKKWFLRHKEILWYSENVTVRSYYFFVLKVHHMMYSFCFSEQLSDGSSINDVTIFSTFFTTYLHLSSWKLPQITILYPPLSHYGWCYLWMIPKTKFSE